MCLIEYHQALSATSDETIPLAAFPYGCHVCEVEVDPDTGVVEIVRYSPGEPAHCFHLVGLPQSFLELQLLLLRAFETGTHSEKGIGDFRDFIAAARIQRVAEVALPQGANTGRACRSR